MIEELVPGALAQDPARGFATRFVTAYANDDADTAVGLYKAARHAGVVPFTESVHALLATVASLTALALEETAPGS
ncbi:hypothetical protein [Streptomyces luteireticuli]|uniref:hypothetical protein n=1 Tax=Streptomyces luteireticuli TaxID=173858 RepID=UPI0035576AAC